MLSLHVPSAVGNMHFLNIVTHDVLRWQRDWNRDCNSVTVSTLVTEMRHVK